MLNGGWAMVWLYQIPIDWPRDRSPIVGQQSTTSLGFYLQEEPRYHALIAFLDKLGLRAAGKQGLEVGVWQGGFSRMQLQGGSHTLHLVDSWRHLPSWNKPFNVDDETFEANFAMVRRLSDAFGERAVLHRNTSLEAAPAFADHSMDYIYIDGDHTVAGVVADCLLWWPKLKPGGVFFGDDYVCSAQHGPQFSMTCVKDVVDTFARVAWKAQVQDLGQQQLAIVKPNP